MIPLGELRRLKKTLQRWSDKLNAIYPVDAQDWEGSASDMETLRNLDTALAEIEGWIAFRANKNCLLDPFLKAAPPHKESQDDNR